MKRKNSPSITAPMAAHIRFLVEQKGLYQHQAAALMSVNPGRVNEVIKGHRFPGVLAAQGPYPV